MLYAHSMGVCVIVTHYPCVCAVIPRICLTVRTYRVCDYVVFCSAQVTRNTLFCSLRVCCEWECHPGASMQLMQVHALERYSLLHVVYACACNIDMSVLQ